MRATTQLTNSASTVFGWLVDQEARLHRGLQLMMLRRALRDAYARFALGHHELRESLFDAHFVETRVAPLLADAIVGDGRLSPEAVAEAWLASFRAPGAPGAAADLAPARAAAAELLAYVEQELGAARGRLDVAPQAEGDPAAAALFAEAVRANSNLELDWLWLASRVTGDFERDFCLRKALQINPDSELARRELAALERWEPARPLIPAVKS